MQGVKGSRLSKWIASKDARRESVGAAEVAESCLCMSVHPVPKPVL